MPSTLDAEVTAHLAPVLLARKQEKRLGAKSTPLVTRSRGEPVPPRSRSRNSAPTLTIRALPMSQRDAWLAPVKNLLVTFRAWVL